MEIKKQRLCRLVGSLKPVSFYIKYSKDEASTQQAKRKVGANWWVLKRVRGLPILCIGNSRITEMVFTYNPKFGRAMFGGWEFIK